MKSFRCCFTNCKFQSDALMQVLEHMDKEHYLLINERKIFAKSQKSGEVKE